jgi:hypothetical protein
MAHMEKMFFEENFKSLKVRTKRRKSKVVFDSKSIKTNSL